MIRKLRTQRDNQLVFQGKGIAKNHKRIAYSKQGGNGP